MSEAEPNIIEHSVEKAHIWLNEVAEELGVEDRQYAYRALRAVLHTLRSPGYCEPTSLPARSTTSWRSCRTSSGC